MPQEQSIYSVYILASQKNGTLYIGVTGDLPTRIIQHQEKQKKGFSSRYNITRLVWWQDFEDVQLAIQREKTMKKWPRQWKINLIEEQNHRWEDLSHLLFSPSPRKNLCKNFWGAAGGNPIRMQIGCRIHLIRIQTNQIHLRNTFVL